MSETEPKPDTDLDADPLAGPEFREPDPFAVEPAAIESATIEPAVGEPEPVPEPVTVRRGVGLPLALGLAGLSALAGAAGGYGLMRYEISQGDPMVAELRADISELRQAQTNLSGQLTEVERTPDPTPRLRALAERLDRLESGMEASPAPTADALDPSVLDQLRTRLDALEDSAITVADGETLPPGSGSVGAGVSAALSRRISALDARLGELEDEVANLGTVPPVPTPTLTYSTEPADTADEEAEAGMAEPTARTPPPSVPPLPAFPFEAVEAALDAAPDGSRGILRRFVRVREAAADDALRDLRGALARTPPALDAALDAYDDLPERAQAPARDWAETARRSLDRRSLETR